MRIAFREGLETDRTVSGTLSTVLAKTVPILADSIQTVTDPEQVLRATSIR